MNCWSHCGEAQFRDGSSRSTSSWMGRGVALGSAPGILDRKEDKLSRDKLSAIWLSCVLMYCGQRENAWLASTKAKVRSICMQWLSLVVRECRHATTAWLSHRHTTRVCAQSGPDCASQNNWKQLFDHNLQPR